MNTYYVDATISVEAESTDEAAEQVSKLINLAVSAREEMSLEHVSEPETEDSLETVLLGLEASYED